MSKKRGKARARSRRHAHQQRTPAQAAESSQELEVSIPNEYFHEVKIDVFYESEKPQTTSSRRNLGTSERGSSIAWTDKTSSDCASHSLRAHLA